MSERVSDAVLDLFCDEAWLDDRPQSHSVLLMARELRDRRRATPDPASGLDEMPVEFRSRVAGCAFAWSRIPEQYDEHLAALHRWHLDAVREAYQDGYEAGHEAGARDEFITRREHPTANPEE